MGGQEQVRLFVYGVSGWLWRMAGGRGGAADSDEDDDVELEEAEPAEEPGQPDEACVVEADEGDAWLFLLLRQLSSCPGPLGARKRPSRFPQ